MGTITCLKVMAFLALVEGNWKRDTFTSY